MAGIKEFIETLKTDEELQLQVEDCGSLEELFEIAKNYEVSMEELKEATKDIG